MRPVGYVRPATAAEAVRLVAAADDASYLAGGTNLVDLMRLGVERPTMLVDVRSLLDQGIAETPGGGLRIGAGVTNSDLAADPVVRREYPVLSRALLAGASGQLRNRATVGGNLLQRTRCPYFTDASKPCNKREPGSGCPARSGVHRELAVLGTSEHCIASHPSDMAVALAMLEARVHVIGADGERALPLDDLYRLPGADPTRDTTLAPDELVTAVELPPPTALSRTATYRKVRDRASFAFALCSIAAGARVAGGVVAEVAVAYGGLGTRPWRARRLEAALTGAPLTRASVDAAVHEELSDAQPLPGNAFKLALATRLTMSTLLPDEGGAR